MTALRALLNTYRDVSQTQREKGTYFEELMIHYFKNEPMYQDLYEEVWMYAEWAEQQGLRKTDTGIDLVAKTHGTNEFHAIQCKHYAETYRLQKSDIDSFFTASGKTIFKQRVIVSTTNDWSQNAQDALVDQQPPVSVITLADLENSQIDWAQYQPTEAPVLKEKKTLRPHQRNALNSVFIQFSKGVERGKLIMACGTGKTFTSLKIAEAVAGEGKRVLFLVPSLSLLSQTLTEWSQESHTPLHNFAVCSDSDVGKKRKEMDDRVQVYTHELQYPATTNAEHLAKEVQTRHDQDHMSVVYSTYHSIAVLNEAQQKHGLPPFDLIICDEAHRTTGATFDGDDESAFVRIHDAGYVEGIKRLYMTATPRIYGEQAKLTDGVTLCSMDDENLFGKELYTITFSEAVSRELLVDYKVLVLAVEESVISRRLQETLKDQFNQLKVDDAAKIVGCWKALSKQGVTDSLIGDSDPMRRAVAFCQVIEKDYKGKNHKVSSKLIKDMFSAVVEEYKQAEIADLLEADPNAVLDPALSLQCEAEHIDGGMNAGEKEAKINWLKAEPPENTCRILSNVRCLSEGVDVPALDAVLFLTPRSSQVDVVQSVGRVMRRAEGKKQGYVILPVVIPAGVEPSQALDDNQTYKVVWQVLNALRSHDDRFDAMINKLEFNGKDTKKMEVIAVANKVQQKQQRKTSKQKAAGKAKGGSSIGSDNEAFAPEQSSLQFEVGEIERALYAKIVKKCGNRHHWEDWANDIAKIANTHIDRIKGILENPEYTNEKAAFDAFAAELRDDLNNSISDDEIIEMLAQHLITKPVFDALFEEYSFAKHNPISQAMRDVLTALHEHALEKERSTLESFYQSIKMRAEGIISAEGKQRIVVELYDKFFRNAFPRMTERLGIVYTPVEVVDFIIHSIEDVLQDEFNTSLADENVHIIDPFTGTGTFITRLLQSGIIPKDKLPHKYQHEIHANEIVLLAYYIAAINIEAVYHGILTGNINGEETGNTIPYTPFSGICLTDTFQLHEKDDLVSELLVDNSARRVKQKSLDIRVIMGNPPYSARQENENDGNKNVKYPNLDARIRNTYAEHSTATNKNALYDSYIRAIRWASDRIGDQGVIGFVTNAGWVEANTADGLRQCLVEEFSKLYIFHLRGNQRTSGERSRKEGGKIFGSGSRAPIAISILVKNPQAAEHGQINFHDIGDYLSQQDKLEVIQELGSLNGITQADSWQTIVPDEFNDWLNQRDPNFDTYIQLGDKKDKTTLSIFENYSAGISTNRDAWCYNASKQNLNANMNLMIDYYNGEVRRYKAKCQEVGQDSLKVSDFINKDEQKISWSSSLISSFNRLESGEFNELSLVKSTYRPFEQRNFYYDSMFNHRLSKMPEIFPTGIEDNLVITLTISGAKNFTLLINNTLCDLHLIGDAQCFPLYLYESNNNAGKADLLSDDTQAPAITRRDAITDDALAYFQAAYPSQAFTKQDIFYYIYGLLHSETYREKYADNLSKQLPRIPCVKTFADFMAFSQAGRALAEWHLNYETITLPSNVKLVSELKSLRITPQQVLGGEDEDFYVTKMKFAKKGDKTKVIYNGKITIDNIPLEAYDYVVNGKPALEWVMERQAVTTDKKSGITNDANDWAIETMQNARYPLELFLRVITVSLETMKIVNALPRLNIKL